MSFFCTARDAGGRRLPLAPGCASQECWQAFACEQDRDAHTHRCHPHEEHEPAAPGTPVVVLGFPRSELDAMDALAWPGAVETWIHEQVRKGLAEAEHRPPEEVTPRP